MMNNPPITPRLMPDGRTAYQVGYVLTYDPQEAMGLLTDTDAPLRCPLTQQAMQLRMWYEMRVMFNPILGERRAVAGIVVDGEWKPI